MDSGFHMAFTPWLFTVPGYSGGTVPDSHGVPISASTPCDAKPLSGPGHVSAERTGSTKTKKSPHLLIKANVGIPYSILKCCDLFRGSTTLCNHARVGIDPKI